MICIEEGRHTMELAQTERGLLARIGFFLCRRARIPEAKRIFTGLAVSDPPKDGPVVGLALCAIIGGESEKAIEMLDERLKAGSPIASTLSLYKLTALGVLGKKADIAKIREEMDAAGMSMEAQMADQITAELMRLSAK
jgi:hypothetical protein